MPCGGVVVEWAWRWCALLLVLVTVVAVGGGAGGVGRQEAGRCAGAVWWCVLGGSVERGGVVVFERCSARKL